MTFPCVRAARLQNWALPFSELFVVLAFGIGWMILEWQGRRLDAKRLAEAEKREPNAGGKDPLRDQPADQP